MILKYRYFLFLILFTLLVVGCKNDELYVGYSNQDIVYQGRIDSLGGGRVNMYWSGSSVRVGFGGQSVYVDMFDEIGDNYYNILLDGKLVKVIKLEPGRNEYLLADSLSAGEHTLELFKRTEWNRGISGFYGFRICGNPKVYNVSDKKARKIEFYGNSITAGYAVEDFSGADCPDSVFTNNYLSYASITARHFNAQYHCICRSGIGVTVSWDDPIMPEVYNRTNPFDANSKWDFRNFSPNIVVVNLFQNDSWLVEKPSYKQFRKRFGDRRPTSRELIDAYKTFVSSLRGKYPNAYIICMLGNMDVTRETSEWPGYVTSAVNEMDDDKIYTHFVPFKKTSGHPSIAEQEKMAESLIEFIDGNIHW